MNTIETKVIAAAAGSGLGAALSAFLLWLLGVAAFGASSAADQVPKALAAVPEPVGALLSLLIAIGGAFIGGFVAPHTHRPDLAVPVPLLPGGVVSAGAPVLIGEQALPRSFTDATGGPEIVDLPGPATVTGVSGH